ncbi:FtsK/SpoIIIE domain-containing protein [Thalassiella azotivora]
MRFSVTVADARSRSRHDVLLDADPDQPLADVLPSVVGALGGEVHPSFAARMDVWVDGVTADPTRTLRENGVRPGSVLGLGGPDGRTVGSPSGVAELRVVSGPGAGRVHRLALGETLVGCGAPGLSLPDLLLPADALAVRVRPDGEVEVEAGGDVEAVLADEPLDGATTWEAGSYLAAGSTVLELVDVEPPDVDVTPARDQLGSDFNRPPRLLPPAREKSFTLPREPGEQVKRPIPWVMVFAPVAMVVPMYLVFQNARVLLFVVMSPLMALANWLSDRRGGRKKYLEDLARFEKETEEVEERIRVAQLAERAERRSAHPDPATVLLTAHGPGRRLWERRRSDPDHLSLRVGLADRPSTVTVKKAGFRDDEDPAPRSLSHVPVALDLRRLGVVGVAGADGAAQAVGRWLLAQAAVLHSPRDVRVVVLTDGDGEREWAWVRWLPHCRVDGELVGAVVGTEQESVGRRLAELGQLVTERLADRPVTGSWTPPGPDVVVVLDGARRLRALPGVVALLRDGPLAGVHVVCLDAEERYLPEECRGVVRVADDRLEVRQTLAEDVSDVLADLVDVEWADRVARALAPVRDTTPKEDDAGLPGSARLLECVDLDPPTPEGVVARWRADGRTTEAVLGYGYDGLFRLDLRRDGPHALVAGTTGSGKSELLQTLVGSLALVNRPDALTFVLVDYKGGSAFKDCARLPHTVGMVTDLDEHLVSRALESLSAELKRREHLLGVPGAKDLEDYWALADKDPSLPVLPRLAIVIDEFASLVAELPDFVKGLVSIAQRGRSLGIHLVLATQRPTGVVSPEIRANTNLRIALRVTDDGESRDVIDAPDAARIAKSTPGRGYARTGHSSLLPFQSGRVGGRRPGARADSGPPRPLAWPLPWSAVGLPAPARPVARGSDTDEGETDLKALVDAVRGAAEGLGVARQPSPWLPSLPEVLTVDDLPAVGAGGADRAGSADGADGDPRVPGSQVAAPRGAAWALEDHPARQAQEPRTFTPGVDDHLYVIGGPRSGRSTALRTIATGLARSASSADVHLYGLDCGNGALLPLEDLPHTGAVVTRTQTERADRLLRRLSAEVTRRQELLSLGGWSDVGEQRAAVDPDERLPYLVLLLDRWEGFVTSLGEVDAGRLSDEVQRLLREGSSAGVHVVLTGDRSLMSGRMGTAVERKLVLRLPDRSDYTLAGLSLKQVPTSMPDGRGLWAESAVEVQVAVLPGDLSGAGQAAAVREVAAACHERDAAVPRGRRPFRLEALPTSAPAAPVLADLVAGAAGGGPLWTPLGVGGDDLELLGLDLAASPVAVVAGPARSGRTSVLRFAAAAASARGVGLLALCPRGEGPLAAQVRAAGGAVEVGTSGPLEGLVERLRALPSPGLVVVDDAEALREGALAPAMQAAVRQAREKGFGILLAGLTSELTTGLTGWLVEARRGRQGLLLSPQSLTDGDAVGVRVQRSQLAGRVLPGRGLLVAPGEDAVSVQVPLVDETG